MKKIRNKKNAEAILKALEINGEIKYSSLSKKYEDITYTIITRADINKWVINYYGYDWIDVTSIHLTLENAIDFLWNDRKCYNEKYTKLI